MPASEMMSGQKMKGFISRRRKLWIEIELVIRPWKPASWTLGKASQIIG